MSIPPAANQLIFISVRQQIMDCFADNLLHKTYPIATGKNGLGEEMGSECTPRGWHTIYSRIGLDAPINSVFVGREWTGEIYDEQLAKKYPERDWILSRVVQLEGLEAGRNKGGKVDSLQRYIYIHGTPDSIKLGHPSSHGCIRMRNRDVIELADWVKLKTPICIE